MKFLIRTCCFLIYVFIVTAIRMTGFIPGAIPAMVLFWLWYSGSQFLCDKWDIKAFEKVATQKGMTPGAYASIKFPPSLLDRCETTKVDKREFERMLKQNIDGEVITKSDANVLRYMFCGRTGK